jgi:hypothetical protein
VLALLETSSVRAVAFKGLASMACLHGPQGRAIADVDVLVGENDFQSALAILRTAPANRWL